MAHAGGIDLGGTKIEARLFDTEDGWRTLDTNETATPRDSYDALLEALAEAARWLSDRGAVTVGIGAPGLVSAEGLALTANLPATGKPLPADLARDVGHPLPIINDCRAFTLSEARLGAGRGAASVLGMVIGTGLAGGFIHDERPLSGPNGQAGEYGHMPMAYDVVTRHDLPWLACGCGRTGCYETICSGPGLARLAENRLGRAVRPADLAAEGGPGAEEVLSIWADVMSALLASLTLALDPEVIVLGGGVAKLPGVTDRLSQALTPRLLQGTRPARIVLAEGGDRSGARGAALFAYELAGAA